VSSRAGASLLGAAKVGVVRTPVNSRLAPREVSHILADSGARLLFLGREFEDLGHGSGLPPGTGPGHKSMRFMRSLPRNAAGKVLRRELRAPF